MSDIAALLIERVREAAQSGTPLSIRGGGSKDFYGEPPAGEPLEVSGHAGIVAYEPTELFITARCGTPLIDIEAALAEKGQCLPFEPPRFSPAATLGGAVAAGLSGPRRASAGALRDYVLGVKLIDGRARELSFGGQVMKNVAGYDVSRLMAGSLGTLGLLLEVSLKVLPRPAAEATLRFALSEAEALERLNRWAGQPLPLAASAWHAGVLYVRLAGARAAVAAAVKQLGGEEVGAGGNEDVPPGADLPRKVGAGGTAFWDALRDQTLPYFATETLWRLSVPPTAPPLELAGETLIEWGGALRWLKSDLPAEAIRAKAAAVGGHATLWRAPEAMKRAVGVFTPLPAPLMQLHKNLKAAFDPQGIFNPGRLYPDL